MNIGFSLWYPGGHQIGLNLVKKLASVMALDPQSMGLIGWMKDDVLAHFIFGGSV